MAGLFVLRDAGAFGAAIDSILLVATAGEHHEWAGRLVYVPF